MNPYLNPMVLNHHVPTPEPEPEAQNLNLEEVANAEGEAATEEAAAE